MRHVALLRGINVGGKNRLPMPTLVTLFEQAGAKRVATYIQSGNVVFDAPARTAARLAAELPRRIEEATGLSVPVVLRSGAELEAVIRESPLLARGVDPDTIHVAFLADAPTPEGIRRLGGAVATVGVDTYELHGRELHLHCPQGIGKSKLSNAYFDSRLSTVSTMRNLRTVKALVELARA